MVPDSRGTWLYFDMVPDEVEIRTGEPEYTGRLCVIGSKLKNVARLNAAGYCKRRLTAMGADTTFLYFGNYVILFYMILFPFSFICVHNVLRKGITQGKQ